MFSWVSLTSSRRLRGWRVNGHVSLLSVLRSTRHHVSYPAMWPRGRARGVRHVANEGVHTTIRRHRVAGQQGVERHVT